MFSAEKPLAVGTVLPSQQLIASLCGLWREKIPQSNPQTSCLWWTLRDFRHDEESQKHSSLLAVCPFTSPIESLWAPGESG